METSLIVHWLTPELGRIATVAKGARRPKSPFRGKLDLCYHAEFSFHRSTKSDLHTLREVVLIDSHPALRCNLALLQQAAYCTALIEQTTETDTPIPVVFDLLLGFLGQLANGRSTHRVLAFELKLLDELGLGPDPANGRVNDAARELAQVLRHCSWTEMAKLHPDRAAAESLRQFLHGFMIYHLGRIPRNRASALAED